MQPGVSKHARLQGDERSTAATASCVLSYEEQGPANLHDMRSTSNTL